MKQGLALRGLLRTLTPGIISTIYYMSRCKAKVSPRSEVDITSRIQLGRGCIIGSFAKLKASEGVLKVGERGGIANSCFLSAGAAGLTIGRNFICGPSVNIVAHNYLHHELDKHLEDIGVTSAGISIGDHVWIGAGATVTDGAVIGNNTIVVANSLVNGKYPDGVILQGAPARIIFRR